jgi:hypothetical protein
MKLFLMLLLAACQIPSVANAQSTNLQGKFHLQNEVRWGKAVLPAGEYSFTIDSTKDNTLFAIVRSADGKKAAFAMATASGDPEPDGSYIFITDDGTRRVRLLNLPEHNLSLAFGQPLSKRDREQLHAAKTEVVPVVLAKK